MTDHQTARETVAVPRPADEVFARIVDLGRSLEEDPDVDEVVRRGVAPAVGGVPQPGTCFEATNRVDGRPEVVEIEVVALDPPHRAVFEVTSRGARTREVVTLHDTGDDGCEVTSVVDHRPHPEGTEVPPATDADPVTGGPPPPESADRPAFQLLGTAAARAVAAEL